MANRLYLYETCLVCIKSHKINYFIKSKILNKNLKRCLFIMRYDLENLENDVRI